MIFPAINLNKPPFFWEDSWGNSQLSLGEDEITHYDWAAGHVLEAESGEWIEWRFADFFGPKLYEIMYMCVCVFLKYSVYIITYMITYMIYIYTHRIHVCYIW